MKKSGLVLPIEIDILNDSILDEGNYKLKTDDNISYELNLLKEGNMLNNRNNIINIRTESDKISGEHSIRMKPSENGLMPRNFSKPFEFMINFEDSPTKDGWIGQSELGCREYRGFSISSSSTGSQLFDNVRLFSFNGELMMLCETYTFHLGKNSGLIS